MRPNTPSITEFVENFALAHQRYSDLRNRILGEVALTEPQYQILCKLAEADPDTWFRVTDLIDQVEVQQSGISKIIRKFHELGFVRAHPNDENQRSKRFRIDDGGYAALDRIYAAMGPEVSQWFTGWTTPQLEQFNRSINALNVRMAATPDEFIPWTC